MAASERWRKEPAAGGQRVGLVRIDPQRLVEVLQGRLVLLRLDVHARSPPIEHRALWAQLNRLRQIIDGRGRIFQQSVDLTARKPVLVAIRPHRERSVRGLERLVILADVGERCGAVGVRLRFVRVQFDRLIEIGNRELVLPLRRKRLAARRYASATWDPILDGLLAVGERFGRSIEWEYRGERTREALRDFVCSSIIRFSNGSESPQASRSCMRRTSATPVAVRLARRPPTPSASLRRLEGGSVVTGAGLRATV